MKGLHMKRLIVATVIAITGLAIYPATANAYVLIGKIWTSTANVKSPYVLSTNMPSAWTTRLSTSNGKWNAFANSTLKTGSVTVTSSPSTFMNAAFTIDYQDLVQAYLINDPGLTTSLATSGNAAHVHLNSNWNWSTAFSANTVDLETVTVHELGHAYGLHHSTLGTGPFTQAAIDAVMNVTYTIKRTPNSDDIAGIAYLY